MFLSPSPGRVSAGQLCWQARPLSIPVHGSTVSNCVQTALCSGRTLAVKDAAGTFECPSPWECG